MGRHRVRVAGRHRWCQQNTLQTSEEEEVVVLNTAAEYDGDDEEVGLEWTQAPGSYPSSPRSAGATPPSAGSAGMLLGGENGSEHTRPDSKVGHTHGIVFALMEG